MGEENLVERTKRLTELAWKAWSDSLAHGRETVMRVGQDAAARADAAEARVKELEAEVDERHAKLVVVADKLAAARAKLQQLSGIACDSERTAQQRIDAIQDVLSGAEAAGAAMSAELTELHARLALIRPLVLQWTREAHVAEHCHEGDDYHLGHGAALRVAARDLDHALERDVIAGERETAKEEE